MPQQYSQKRLLTTDEKIPSIYVCCRCNLAVMLMTDLIVDGIDIDWSAHLPHLLHVIFLGKKVI